MNIHDALTTMPASKATAAEEAEELRRLWQVAKLDAQSAEAKFGLKLKAEKPDLRATDIKMEIDNDDD